MHNTISHSLKQLHRPRPILPVADHAHEQDTLHLLSNETLCSPPPCETPSQDHRPMRIEPTRQSQRPRAARHLPHQEGL